MPGPIWSHSLTESGCYKNPETQVLHQPAISGSVSVRTLALGILISILLNLLKDGNDAKAGGGESQLLGIPWNGVNAGVDWKKNYSFQLLHNKLRTLNPEYNLQNISRADDHLWFITATSSNTVQRPVLVRMAQCLFPIRQWVTWVIVQDTRSVEKEGTLRVEHQLKRLHRLLRRFGIAYVLLQSRMYRSFKRMDGFGSDGSSRRDEEAWDISARQTGLIWVLENAPRGIALLADVETAFNYQIFSEVRKTRKYSVWPVGLGRPLGLSSPLVDASSGHVLGYHSGSRILLHSAIMDLSGFAINLSFIRHSIETENLWKLTFDGLYSADSIGIKMEDIEPIAWNCSKILVWRSCTYVPLLPRKVNFEHAWRKTNVEALLKDIYGRRYSSITAFNRNGSNRIPKV